MHTADLIHAQNFHGLKHLSEISMRDYVDYMKAWSDKNSRVKNAQFHVAISVRGREKSAEEILEISREWLSKMGYKDTPSLFFFHRDTDNNHIHIISTRVDKDGKKIKDNNEIRRGVSLIRELNGIDLSRKAKEDFVTLQEYKVSSKSQISTLWGSLGYRTKKIGNDLMLYKEGQLVLQMGAMSIESQVEKSSLTNERASEIRALITQYHKDFSVDALMVLMKEKHNLEIVLQGKKDSPYGYAIIDHRYKKVYKGGDVFSLKELLSDQQVFSDREQVERVNLFARSLIKDSRITSKELESVIKQWGVNVYKGEVKYKKFSIGELEKDLKEKLEYNDRLEAASRFQVRDLSSLEVLAKYYRVSAYDIIPKEEDNKPQSRDLKEIYNEARESDDFYGKLSEYNLSVSSHEGQVYLLDEENGILEEVDSYEQKTRYGYSEHASQSSIGSFLSSNSPNLDLGGEEKTSSADNRLKKRRRDR